MKEYIVATIQKAFEVPIELAEGLYTELMQCVENKNLVSIRLPVVQIFWCERQVSF